MPGLGVVPVLVGAVERLRRAVEIAHPQPDLADLVLRVPDGVHEPEPLELLARLARLLLGLRPLSAEHLELRAMDPADARIAADAPGGASSARPRRPTAPARSRSPTFRQAAIVLQ